MPDQSVDNSSSFSSVQQVPTHIHNGLDAPQIPFSSIRDYSISNDGTMASNSATLIPTQQAVVTYVATQLGNGGMEYFGDGSDGSLTVSSAITTTLTRDTYYNNVTISNNAIINTAGYRLFVKGTLTINSSANIQYNGSNGTAGGSGASGGTGGAGASALAAGSGL